MSDSSTAINDTPSLDDDPEGECPECGLPLMDPDYDTDWPCHYCGRANGSEDPA